MTGFLVGRGYGLTHFDRSSIDICFGYFSVPASLLATGDVAMPNQEISPNMRLQTQDFPSIKCEIFRGRVQDGMSRRTLFMIS